MYNHLLEEFIPNEIIIIMVLVIVAMIAIIAYIVYLWRLQEREKYDARVEKIVLETSKKYKAVLSINERYHFHEDILESYTILKVLNSKQEFDRFWLDNVLEEEIRIRLSYYENMINKIQENSDKNIKYNEEIVNTPNYLLEIEVGDIGISFEDYSNKENELVQKAIKEPVYAPSFICYKQYTSPQGRNEYEAANIYTYTEFLMHYQNVKKQIYVSESKECQRALMTESLRYDILKRDRFRCVLCGRSANEDGVKLEVDHIIPISKGGKTVPDNLRTLCMDCNRGKRDKYDENSPN